MKQLLKLPPKSKKAVQLLNPEIHLFQFEDWKKVEFDFKLNLNYAITNYGRVISFNDDIKSGYLMKLNKNGGPAKFEVFQVKTTVINSEGVKIRKTINRYVHREVAKAFLAKPSEDHNYAIHLDHDIYNNRVENIKWVTKAESFKHIHQSPNWLKAAENNKIHNKNGKLNLASASKLKQMIADGKTRDKMLAKMFNVSEMVIYKIRYGISWKQIPIIIPDEVKRAKMAKGNKIWNPPTE